VPSGVKKRGIAAKVAGAVILAAGALMAIFVFQQLRGLGGSPEKSVVPPLRLTAQQMSLNWQSFPGRHVAVEFCSALLSGTDRFICRVFDGAREAGYLLLDPATIDPASANWIRANCTTAVSARACTVRATGTLRKGADGRPVLEGAKVELR
jgi:hypothetical protein